VDNERGDFVVPFTSTPPRFVSLMVLAVAPNPLDPRLGLGFLAIAVVTAVGFYLVRKLRDHVLKEETTSTSDLMDFQEINSQGDISPEEFRTIKTALAARIVGVSKDVKFTPDESKPDS
jgi:hypothetical protein